MTVTTRAVLLAATMLVSGTAQAQSSVGPPMTPAEQRLAAQVEQQATEIRQLREQLGELTRVIGTRVAATEAATDSGKVIITQPSPRLESNDAAFSLAFVGSLQPQTAFYSQSHQAPGAPQLNNGTSFRRAHFGVQGVAYTDFAYALIFDGAATGGVTSSIRDATIAYSGWRPFTFTFGNQKPQAGLEPLFSDRSDAATFMEPGLPAALATVNGTRSIGARISTGSEHYSVTAGVFGDDINNAGIANPVAEGWGWHGRLTVAPIATPTRLIHLGVSAYTRKPGTGRATSASTDPVLSQLRFRATPEMTVDTTPLVDTGNLTRASRYDYLGLEAAAMIGPLSVQGEWAQSRVAQQAGRVDLDFNGAYVLTSLFLTGESRVYDPRTGVFVRTRPRHNFGGGNWGAFELAARWSRLDLDSHVDELANGGIRGGVLTDYTLALNWYLNPYLRMQANYIHAEARRRSATGVDLGTDANILGLRLQQEW